MIVSPVPRQDTWSAQELGLNGVLLTGSQTSNVFPIEGFNLMTIRAKLTRVAATRIDINLDTVQKPHTLLSEAIPANLFDRTTATTTAAGVITLDQLIAERTVTGSENFTFVIGISGWRARLTLPAAQGPATTDTIIVSVTLEVA